ncbi:MAG: LysR family transcriptional regulator [Desulfuromonadaceae bacterium]|nr:LysR family transcriptional regulator [Desulfuromonadaceae bacterium]MDD2850098.1 LysR family transcriptional regulator [Desulfuromonadaceae bacterium]MDD4130355.1 LysR family transcriptional regulator [Desulfuromonadaceae bacterium]
MESVYLKTLVEVVKAGSISKAADKLCVTQPAISRRIKFIEEQYGYPLLDRSGQTLLLTTAGRLVFEKAEKLLEIERELLSGLKSMRENKSIAFICTPTFGIVHLPTIMREFMMEFNDLADLSFMFDTPGKIVEALRDGMYDLAIIEHCECFDFSNLATVALPGDEMIFVSSPALAIPAGNPGNDALFAQNVFVRKEGCCSRTLLEGNLRAIGSELSDFRSFVVIDDLHMIIQVTLEGQGVSFLSRELVQEQLDAGLLREHRIDGFRHHRNRTMIIHGDCHQQQNPPLNYFIDILTKRFVSPRSC